MPQINRVTVEYLPEHDAVVIAEKADAGIQLADPVVIAIPADSMLLVMSQVIQAKAQKNIMDKTKPQSNIISLNGKHKP